MSRCFPFPPPGYERQPRAENLDLLAKEKRKEKKHKKEKKEKEKRERKEKKDKDRSKDKRKEKKDRKEKHKDRKKDKDVDKGRSSEDRKENEGTHNRESLQKAEEGKDSKFAEELGKRTRDDGAANPMVGSITSSIHNKIEQIVVSRPSLEKDRATDKKMFPLHVGSSQGNDGSSLPVENAANFPQRRIGNTATFMDQEKNKLHERFNVGINTDQNRNHGISRSIEGFPGVVNRKTEYSTVGMEKEKKLVSNSIAPANNNRGKLGATVAASNSASTKGKNDVLGLSLDNLSSLRSKTEPMANSIIQSRMDGIEKERFKGGGMLPHPVTSANSRQQQQHQAFIPLRGVNQQPITSEQRRNTPIFQPVQKDRNQKDEVPKGLEDKEHTAAKKNKRKDENKHSKEEEKILEKPAMIENNKIRSFGKKDQIDTLNSKPLAPHKDSSAGIRGVDETSNKRKNIKINGFIQENDARPSKIPRMVASSSQPFSGLPVKSDIILLDNKDKRINGSAKSQQLPDGNGEVSSKSPHPDSKYLDQIYAVPKMEPWSANDDVEWLFNRCESSQQKPKRQAVSEQSAPQVWAKALRIESADVLALPYVVPF
ncbi:myb-like protein X [Dendrobium catenatum]|uniref:Uncharacterized protein n=1 Tax=Dendrobium catenatum TaxID=906689 RepID=A0A2I0WKG5_9ASPA|nr:myb-like protein X [Dendrobium catenatum]PKU76146.1 hypothetical protein MA16_Dca017559 [Dendrobium catenatum]